MINCKENRTLRGEHRSIYPTFSRAVPRFLEGLGRAPFFRPAATGEWTDMPHITHEGLGASSLSVPGRAATQVKKACQAQVAAHSSPDSHCPEAPQPSDLQHSLSDATHSPRAATA